MEVLRTFRAVWFLGGQPEGFFSFALATDHGPKRKGPTPLHRSFRKRKHMQNFMALSSPAL